MTVFPFSDSGLFPTTAGGMGARMRVHAWTETPLGAPGEWSVVLRTLVGVMLGSKQPMFVAWGSERTLIYNDGYAEILGRKHPGALGRPFFEVWAEIRADLLPLVAAIDAGESVHMDDITLVMDRHAQPDEAHFSFSYTPVRDEMGRIAGFFCPCTETTGQVLADRRLRESEARFRNMADNAPVMMWITDPTGYCSYLNARWYEFTGQSEAEALGLGWTHATHPDDQKFAEEAFLAANAAQRTFRIEYRLRRRDGIYRWAIDAASPRFAEDGSFLGYVGSVIDIDERREAEEALRASEAQFRAYAQTVPNHVWTASPDGVLDWFNERVYAYSGTEAGELDDGRWADIVHEDDVALAAQRWSAALASGETYETEFRLRRADGAYRWHIARAVPIRTETGTVTRWIGTNTDIEDRRAAEDTLRAVNASLSVSVEARTAERDRVWRNSRDLLVIIGPDGVFRAVNPAWTAILGHEPADVVGRSFLEFIWPDDAAVTQDGFDPATAESDLTNFENRYRHKDGSPRWISWRTSAEGGLVYAYGRHVTDEKLQAEALRQAEEQLRQSQKLEAVGQLTGGVAHDFNNLLTVIRSSTDLLKRPDLPEERRRRYVDAISDTVTRAAKLTGQLLAFARRQALKPEVFDVVASVAAVGDMIGTLTGSRIEIVTQMPDEPCFANADPSQFDTALVNMAANARDAMDGEGQFTIDVRAVAGIPMAGALRAVAGEFVAVSLADTGSGIAPDQLDRIFEPFFTTKGVGQGTGLGLSQVFGFAKQSGGEIRVRSQLGRGTTFTLYLPRVGGEASAPSAPGELEPLVDGHGTCVLVVEDNPEVGAFATQTLTELGYRTVWAGNADEALAELATDAARFDVVFSDVMMPGMNGIDLAQEIRRRHAELPVVLASGYSHVLAQKGTFGFELLHKPYSIEQLSRTLRKAASPQGRRKIGR